MGSQQTLVDNLAESPAPSVEIFDRSVESSSPKSWSDFLRTSLGLLFPSRCPLCIAQIDFFSLYPRFCDPCSSLLLADPDELCKICGGPIPDLAVANEQCAQCRGQQFRFDRAIPLGPYRSKLRDVVIRMKEPRAAALAVAIGHLMSRRARDVLAADVPQLLTFSPMHWGRRINRRVNNAERLANAFARELGIPVHRRLVVCARRTRKQSLLSVHQRRENVRAAFKVTDNVDLDGLHVGLVDDTMTTGATADEITRVLLRGGAARVTVFLAARGVFR